MAEKIKILIAAPEVYPFQNNTGFAYILNGFAKGLVDLGCDVRIVMPRYKNTIIEYDTLVDFPVQIDWNKATAIIRQSSIPHGDQNIPVYFVDNYQYFDREKPYNHFDEAERFAFFSRSLIEMLPKIDFKPDIIHCNDWETGPVAVMLKTQYENDDFYKNIKTVFTIHNVSYQGNYPREVLKLLNLGDEYFTPEKMEFYGEISYMKGGLMFSDVITTLSSIYATKLQTSDFGEKMDGVLRYRADDFYGIINGIDYNVFDPQNDKCISYNYGIEDINSKKDNKYALQSEIGLPNRDVPVIAIISKFQKEKGFDLLEEILPEIMAYDVQLIFFGKGDTHYESMLIRAKGKYTDKIGLWIGENEDLEHRIFAGSDIFLVPSMFEFLPFRQMVAMRYGTVPIVRASGDVEDIVSNYDFKNNKGTGFVFSDYSAIQLLDVIRRVVVLYNERPDIWKDIMLQDMKEDFSFSRTVREYIEIYKIAMRKK